MVPLCLRGLDPGSLWAQEPATWQEPAWYMSNLPASGNNPLKEWRTKKSIDARNALGVNSPNTQQSQLLKELVHFYLSQLLQSPDNPIRDVVDRLLGEINRANTTTAARTIIIEEVLSLARTLLTHPESQIRTDTMVLVIQLNSVPYSISTGTEVPAVPYLGAAKLLISVLKDETQLLECRILAARGLARIGRDGSPSLVEKSEMAVALVGALGTIPAGTSDETWWFRYRVIEALGYVDRIDDVSGKPIVVETLLKVIADPQETWINRSQAALSISRLPYSGSVNVPLITHEIVKLIAQMTDAYNKSPKSSTWKHAFSRTYLAFRPADSKQANKRWGLLEQVKRPGVTNHERKVLDAWDASFSVFQSVLTASGTPIPDAASQKLKTWIAENAPTDRSVAPGAAPLAVNARNAANSGG